MKKVSNNIINILFFLICLTFSLGDIGRISFIGQQINFYFFEVFLSLSVGVFGLVYQLKAIKYSVQIYKSWWILFGYLFLTFIVTSFTFSGFQNFVGLLYFLRFFVYFLYFVFLIYHIHKDPQFKTVIQKSLFTVIFLTILFSLVQYFLYPNFRNISYLGWDPHWYRLLGAFFDPPIAGAILGMLFIFLFFEKNQIHKLLKYFLLTVFFIFIFLTYSRGTLLAFFLVTFAWVFRKKAIYGILIAAIFLLGLIIVPKPFGESVNLLRTFSIYSRLSNYQEAVQVWQKQPILGVGYNRIRYAKGEKAFANETDFENNHAGASFHSSFLIMLVTGGVIGLGLFLWALYTTATLSQFALWSILFLSIVSLTDNVLLHPFVLALLFIGTTYFNEKKYLK